ncbi:MAG TPA: membrane dipeptidase [Sphingobium sp.]
MCGRCIEGSVPDSRRGDDTGEDWREASEAIEIGRAFLARHPTVDIHAHPGRFFFDGETSGTSLVQHLGEPFIDRSLDEMRAGNISAVMFATVADHVLLELSDRGLRAVRDYRPGEAYLDHKRQMSLLAQIGSRAGIRLAASSGDVLAARAADQIAALLSIEGGDFIEDRLERIEEAAAAGVRSITIIHYNINQIGDTQTESDVHGGLTSFGRDVVTTMERTNVIVDLAHASRSTCVDVAGLATRPFIMSHTNLKRGDQSHPRLVDLDMARLVVDSGGLMGAVSAGFDQDGIDDYLDTICDMVDRLGIDHVAIGTDMDYTYKPVLEGYRQWPLLIGKLLGRGMAEMELAKIAGGNMLRLLG